jgi:hypothetical protein
MDVITQSFYYDYQQICYELYTVFYATYEAPFPMEAFKLIAEIRREFIQNFAKENPTISYDEKIVFNINIDQMSKANMEDECKKAIMYDFSK